MITFCGLCKFPTAAVDKYERKRKPHAADRFACSGLGNYPLFEILL